jgi:hypothetical protein
VTKLILVVLLLIGGASVPPAHVERAAHIDGGERAIGRHWCWMASTYEGQRVLEDLLDSPGVKVGSPGEREVFCWAVCGADNVYCQNECGSCLDNPPKSWNTE